MSSSKNYILGSIYIINLVIYVITFIFLCSHAAWTNITFQKGLLPFHFASSPFLHFVINLSITLSTSKPCYQPWNIVINLETYLSTSNTHCLWYTPFLIFLGLFFVWKKLTCLICLLNRFFWLIYISPFKICFWDSFDLLEWIFEIYRCKYLSSQLLLENWLII